MYNTYCFSFTDSGGLKNAAKALIVIWRIMTKYKLPFNVGINCDLGNNDKI